MQYQKLSNDASYAAARKWLASLGVLCAGSISVEEATMRVAAMATLLAENFQASAFCQRSLESVSRQCKFFPAYGEVAEMLSVWQRDNPPPHTALAAPGEVGTFIGWNASDHSWLKFWRDQVSAGFPPHKDAPTIRRPDVLSDRPVDHRRAHIEALIRQMSPLAGAYIAEGKA